MRKLIFTAAACLCLAGCQTAEERAAIAQKNAVAQEQKQQIAAAMASKKISFALGVRAMNEIDRRDNPNQSSAMREAALYQEALAEKVDAGQVSVKEYLYLTEKQRNDVFDRAEASVRQERMTAAAEEVASNRPSFANAYAARLLRGY